MVAVTVVGFAVPVAAQTEEFVEIPTQIEVGESGAAVLFGIVNPGDGTLDIQLSTDGAFEIVVLVNSDDDPFLGCVTTPTSDYFGLTCDIAEFWQNTVVIVPTDETLALPSATGTLTTTVNSPFSEVVETTLIWENPNPPTEPPAEDPPAEEEPPAEEPAPELLCNGEAVTVNLANGDVPTDGNDVIVGTEGPDVIDAGAGADIICGLGGDDIINAGNGADVVMAGGGNDTVQAGQGRDTVYGQGGDDAIVGGKGKDTLIGGGGNDDIRGNDGVDTLDGGAGRDELRGGQGADVVTGGSGADVLVGGIRPDVLDGERGTDSYNGGAGSDTCAVDPEGRAEVANSCEFS